MRLIDRLVKRNAETCGDDHTLMPCCEALEPRLLLAGDLSGVFGTVTLGANPMPGDDFTATLFIINSGPGNVDERISIQYWMTTDGTLDGIGDYYLESENADVVLGPGGMLAVVEGLDLPSAMIPGPYRLMAVIDAYNEVLEPNEANNFPFTPPTGAPYWVTLPFEDLTGAFVSTTLGANPVAGDDFWATLNITNIGNDEVDDEIAVQFWMTTDGTLDGMGDYYLGHKTQDIYLDPGVTVAMSKELHLPSWMIPGPYRLMAFIDSDNDVAESNELNNFPFTPAAGAPFWVQAKAVDLTGAFVSATLGANPVAGDDFWATLNITNVGTDKVDEKITVQYWMTTDGTLDGAGDYYLGHEEVKADLAPGATLATSESLHLPSWMIPGPYRLMAFIDSDNDVTESNELNNFPFTPAAGAPFWVQAKAVDLTGAFVSTTLGANPSAGTDFWATLNITNVGTDDVDEKITVRYWMTTDGVLDGVGDYYLGHEEVKVDLAPGATLATSESLHLPSWMIPGPYRLMAVIDADNEVIESNEANNFPFTPSAGAPYNVL